MGDCSDGLDIRRSLRWILGRRILSPVREAQCGRADLYTLPQGPVSWTVISEIFPLSTRSHGTSFGA